jgi:hypothetical protein
LPIYHEPLLAAAPGEANRYVIQFFRQPRHRRLIADAYARWSKISWPVMSQLERPLRIWHLLTCEGCDVVWDNEGNGRNYCNYMPLTNRQDCREFELGQVERENITEVRISLNQARMLGWTRDLPASRVPEPAGNQEQYDGEKGQPQQPLDGEADDGQDQPDHQQ